MLRDHRGYLQQPVIYPRTRLRRVAFHGRRLSHRMQVLPGVTRSPTSREAFRRMRAKWQNGAFATTMELGAAHTRVVYRALRSTEAVIYANTTSDIQSHCSAGWKDALKLERAASQARRTALDMKPSTIRASCANGNRARGYSAELITW